MYKIIKNIINKHKSSHVEIVGVLIKRRVYHYDVTRVYDKLWEEKYKFSMATRIWWRQMNTRHEWQNKTIGEILEKILTKYGKA